MRPVGPDDAELLLRLQTAHQVCVVGQPDTSLDECRDLVTDPDLDPASVLALDDDGDPLGCALVYPAGGAPSVELEVVVDPTRGLDLLPGSSSGLCTRPPRPERPAGTTGWTSTRAATGRTSSSPRR